MRDEPDCRKALAGHPSPVGLRWWQPQAEESEKRLGEDGNGNDERALDDDRAQGVGKDVTEQHLARASPTRPGRFDELALSNAERLAAHEPGHVHPDGHGDGDHDGEQAGAEQQVEHQRDQQRRDAVEDVDHETDHAVYPAAKVAGDEPEGHADDHDDQRGAHSDGKRNLRPDHQAAQGIAPVFVAAEWVSRARRRVREARAEGVRFVRRPEERDDRDQHEKDEVEDRHEGELVAPQSPPSIAPQADLLARKGAARVLDGCSWCDDGGCHQYRILGSMTV